MTKNLIRLVIVAIVMCFGPKVKAQQIPTEISSALKADDAEKLNTLISKSNINTCYGNYSILSDAVRDNAKKCFDLLIENGADVNLSCNGYVPPLMHAAKYGRLEMVKILVAKGADINYIYHGEYEPAEGQTPISYAELFKHIDIVDYLKSVHK